MKTNSVKPHLPKTHEGDYDLFYAIEVRGKSIGEVYGPDAFVQFGPGSEAHIITFHDSIQVAYPWQSVLEVPEWHQILYAATNCNPKRRDITKEEWKKWKRIYRTIHNRDEYVSRTL